MDSLLHYWPLVAFISGLFFAGLGVAIGLTMWIMGKLIEQDAKRIEMKESILLEVRNRHHSLDEHIDELGDEMNTLGNRMTRVETMLAWKAQDFVKLGPHTP